MYTITYTTFDHDCNDTGTDTSNFASLDVFEMIDRADVIAWAYYNEDGKQAGSGYGANAGPEMFAFDAMIQRRRAA